VRGNIKSFEKPFTHGEVVALADRTLKRFGGDRNKAGRYARSMENRYESSKWAQVVEVLATSGRHHATMKKSPAQLDREIAQALGHATKASTKRWNHNSVARSLDVPEDVVRRIYGAVQTAKRQGLYGGYLADLIERSVGRKLRGTEYTVAAHAKEYLGYGLPGGYGGPKPTGSAKEPQRVKYDDPKFQRGQQLSLNANRTIADVLRRRQLGWVTSSDEAAKQRDLLRQAADELDVAADLYEEAGAEISAETLHERARLARRGDYAALATYE
jgi:hypothetical protein